MMKTKLMIGLIVCLSCLLILSEELSAQPANDTTTFYRIETTDGNEFFGSVVTQNNDSLVLKTSNYGELTLRKIYITKVTKLQPKVYRLGEYWPENLQAGRYFWVPSGLGLKAGEGYYQNVWVMFNQFAVGVTDWLSLGGGMVPLFLFPETETPVWFSPKISIPVSRDKFSLGAGALVGTLIGGGNSGFGIIYGLSTIGDRSNNITFGMGYGYSQGDFNDNPTLSLSFMIRTGPKGYIVSENYYIGMGDDPLTLIMLGGRSLIKKVGLDYGLVVPFYSDMEGFFAIPWLGFTVPFGKVDY
jgi:hypothetical protein